MWFISILHYEGNATELLFDTEQDLKKFIEKRKPTQYTFKYIKKYVDTGY